MPALPRDYLTRVRHDHPLAGPSQQDIGPAILRTYYAFGAGPTNSFANLAYPGTVAATDASSTGPLARVATIDGSPGIALDGSSQRITASGTAGVDFPPSFPAAYTVWCRFLPRAFPVSISGPYVSPMNQWNYSSQFYGNQAFNLTFFNNSSGRPANSFEFAVRSGSGTTYTNDHVVFDPTADLNGIWTVVGTVQGGAPGIWTLMVWTPSGPKYLTKSASMTLQYTADRLQFGAIDGHYGAFTLLGAGVWINRALTFPEAEWLHFDPWDLIRPPRRGVSFSAVPFSLWPGAMLCHLSPQIAP